MRSFLCAIVKWFYFLLFSPVDSQSIAETGRSDSHSWCGRSLPTERALVLDGPEREAAKEGPEAHKFPLPEEENPRVSKALALSGT